MLFEDGPASSGCYYAIVNFENDNFTYVDYPSDCPFNNILPTVEPSEPFESTSAYAYPTNVPNTPTFVPTMTPTVTPTVIPTVIPTATSTFMFTSVTLSDVLTTSPSGVSLTTESSSANAQSTEAVPVERDQSTNSRFGIEVYIAVLVVASVILVIACGFGVVLAFKKKKRNREKMNEENIVAIILQRKREKNSKAKASVGTFDVDLREFRNSVNLSRQSDGIDVAGNTNVDERLGEKDHTVSVTVNNNKNEKLDVSMSNESLYGIGNTMNNEGDDDDHDINATRFGDRELTMDSMEEKHEIEIENIDGINTDKQDFEKKNVDTDDNIINNTDIEKAKKIESHTQDDDSTGETEIRIMDDEKSADGDDRSCSKNINVIYQGNDNGDDNNDDNNDDANEKNQKRSENN